MSHIDPVGGSESLFGAQESQAEKQKLFDIEWETDLISAFVNVTEQNSQYDHPVQSVKHELTQVGAKSESLLNQLTSQLQLPSFSMSGDEALMSKAQSVQTHVQAAVDHKKLDAGLGNEVLKQLEEVIFGIGSSPQNATIEALNSAINQANSGLSEGCRLPPIQTFAS